MDLLHQRTTAAVDHPGLADRQPVYRPDVQANEDRHPKDPRPRLSMAVLGYFPSFLFLDADLHRTDIR